MSILAGCKDSERKSSTGAYFGGHIVNPTSEYLTLTNASTIDSSRIDEEGNFAVRKRKVEEGLYTFDHGHESHSIYLSPGDSLLLWGNTLDFEESLHFSGIGGERNNFLLDLFLLNQENTDLVLNYYKIPPAEFKAITDSIKDQRLQYLNNLKEEKGFSENFVDFAEKMILFELGNLREQYAYLINKYYTEFSDDFSDDFFAYRSDISFNETAHQSNPFYLRLLENYLINLSMEDCPGPPENNDCYNINDHENITRRIALADSLTDLPKVKNYIFNRLGSTGMVMGQNREELRAILETLQERGIPHEDFRKLLTLGSIQLAFIPGINIGNTPLITPEQKQISVNDIIDKESIVYIWSINSPSHHKEQHKTITELKAKYPDIDFIGINVDIGKTSAWENALRKYGYDLKSEYQLDSVKIQGREVKAELFRSYLNKLLFLDPSGTVKIGDAYLNSPDFESRVLEFLNL